MWEILFQNQNFVAINKPCHIAVHQEENQISLTQTLAAQLSLERVWLLHRLDKATSGVLLLALNEQTASELGQQFSAKTMRKTYLALSDTKPSKKQGWIKGGMEKSRRGAWKLTRDMANPAITQFHSHAIAPNLRLFVLQPHTGKTHQLRVAMKSLGSPILGDELYGETPAQRMYLHAWKIEFQHRGEHFKITATLDTIWPSEYIYAVLSPSL